MFLDRDGTLIVEKNYLGNPDDVVLERFVVPGLLLLQNKGYFLVVVTNQSGIGRGLVTIDQYLAVQKRLDEVLRAQNIELAATYYCPHLPDENCDCRKPKPGMILDAARDLHIDLKQSFLVGDKLSDIEAGRNAGVRTILVKTGYGAGFSEKVSADFVAENLLEAVEALKL